MPHSDPPPAPSRRLWPAVLASAGAVFLAAVVLVAALWPGTGDRAQSAPRHRAARARLTSVAAQGVAAPIPAWERRAIADLPPRLRDRAVRTLAKRPGTSDCITGPGQAERGQAWLTGFADVTKLRGAALVGPAFANVVVATKEIICPTSVTEVSTEVPAFRGKPEFPPVRATFLAFGFVPVTAAIAISQVGVGVINLTLATGVAAVAPYVVQATARVNIKVLNVKVDGVTLPAGADCGTAVPGHVTLSNVNPTGQPGRNFWDLFTGGPLSGTVQVPHFARCGVNGDNLDPILDASISGSQNFAKLIQGEPCIFDNLLNTSCPPKIPAPRR